MVSQFSVKDRNGTVKTVIADGFEEAAILSGLTGPLLVIEIASSREARFSVHDNKAVLIGFLPTQ